MAKTRHDKSFDMEHQWQLFLERCDLTGPLPEDQQREMRKAFFGSAGQLLLLMRDDISELRMDEGVQVMKRLLNQVGQFWENALKEHQAAKGKFQATDRDKWEQDVLEDNVFNGTTPAVRLVKKPNDEQTTRASCGGDERGMYITYRGDLPAVEKVLKNCLKAVTHMMILKNTDNQ